MLLAVNALMKRRAPRLHRVLRRIWRQAPFPVPKLLLGKLVWAHSHLVTQQITESHVLRWISEGLRPGDVFIDVGAHYGWMSLLAARLVGQNGKVIAIEPSPPLIDFLSYHKRVNRLKQLNIVPRAVTDADGARVPFLLIEGGHSSMNSLVMHPNVVDVSPDNKLSIPVETITLDSFWRESRLCPAMIKIDVEGAELLVLRGSKFLLTQSHPALIIAVHPSWLPDGQRSDDLFDLLRTYGYRVLDSHVVCYKGADFGDYLCIADRA